MPIIIKLSNVGMKCAYDFYMNYELKDLKISFLSVKQNIVNNTLCIKFVNVVEKFMFCGKNNS